MLDALNTSKTSVNWVLKFRKKYNSWSHIGSLEERFGASQEALQIELKRTEKDEFLNFRMLGNKRIVYANTQHSPFSAIQSLRVYPFSLDRIIMKVFGADKFAKHFEIVSVVFLLPIMP